MGDNSLFHNRTKIRHNLTCIYVLQIFCNTRKGVLQTANTLSNDLTISMPAAHKNLVTESVKKIGEGSLKG